MSFASRTVTRRPAGARVPQLHPYTVEPIDDEPGCLIIAPSMAVAYSVLAERRAWNNSRGRRPHITAVAMRPIEE